MMERESKVDGDSSWEAPLSGPRSLNFTTSREPEPQDRRLWKFVLFLRSLTKFLLLHSTVFLYNFYPLDVCIMDNASSSSTSAPAADKKKPVVIITIGMAGAGKSTFVQRINSYLHSKEPPSPPYVLNLDPAVTSTNFEPNIDIRDTVDYQEVMKQCVPVQLLSTLTLIS